MAEVPFDAAYKLMATFHNMHKPTGEPVVRLRQGRPDVLLERSKFGINPKGQVIELTDEHRGMVMQGNERLASQGMRVLAPARASTRKPRPRVPTCSLS